MTIATMMMTIVTMMMTMATWTIATMMRLLMTLTMAVTTVMYCALVLQRSNPTIIPTLTLMTLTLMSLMLALMTNDDDAAVTINVDNDDQYSMAPLTGHPQE